MNWISSTDTYRSIELRRRKSGLGKVSGMSCTPTGACTVSFLGCCSGEKKHGQLVWLLAQLALFWIPQSHLLASVSDFSVVRWNFAGVRHKHLTKALLGDFGQLITTLLRLVSWVSFTKENNVSRLEQLPSYRFKSIEQSLSDSSKSILPAASEIKAKTINSFILIF